jgi:hypothetical protein
MSRKKYFSLIAALFYTAAILFLHSCIDLYNTKKDPILHLYTSPKFSNYKLDKIGLLPMVRDDTTSVGTFYSTNYFFKLLKLSFPKKKFEMIEISHLTDYDSLLIPNLIDSIESSKHMDLGKFYSYDLDTLLNNKNVDAVLIGSINDKDNLFGSSYDVRYRSFLFAYSTECEFSYYLISMRDGRVLWKADVIGTESYYYERVQAIFPPLDAAISKGIDAIIPKLPF